MSLFTFQNIAKISNLKVIDVEEIPTHGGSLRIWLSRNSSNHDISKNVENILIKEKSFGLLSKTIFEDFRNKTLSVKISLLKLLIELKLKNKKVIAYGAAAKGNTLFNYIGITKDLIPAVIDKAESKQGKFLPGSHIPILKLSELKKINPDFILVLPWNLISEIKEQLPHYKLITAIPNIQEH